MTLYHHKGGEMSDLLKKLSLNLIEARRGRGLSQEALSKLSLTPRTTIASIERMESSPSIETLNKIAVALQMRIDELLSERKSPIEHIAYKDIKLRKFKDGNVKVFKLLPDNLDSIEFERLELVRDFTKVGVPHLPRTKEYFHCVKGSIEVRVDGESHLLKEGDLLCFPGDLKHSYTNKSLKTSVGITMVIFN